MYVSRFDNTPGKVTLKNGRIHEFCVHDIGCSSTGEILLTNRHWEWKEIKKDWNIPENAVKNGLNRSGYYAFIGKSLCGEPGWLYSCSNETKKMFDINCYSKGVIYCGYILVYSEEI